MKCEVCGMNIKGNPIYEKIDGELRCYCCRECLEYNICTCGRSLRTLNKKLELTKGVNKNQVEVRPNPFECHYCKKILNDNMKFVEKHGKKFCNQDHAIKWNNLIIDKIYRQSGGDKYGTFY